MSLRILQDNTVLYHVVMVTNCPFIIYLSAVLPVGRFIDFCIELAPVIFHWFVVIVELTLNFGHSNALPQLY